MHLLWNRKIPTKMFSITKYVYSLKAQISKLLAFTQRFINISKKYYAASDFTIVLTEFNNFLLRHGTISIFVFVLLTKKITNSFWWYCTNSFLQYFINMFCFNKFIKKTVFTIFRKHCFFNLIQNPNTFFSHKHKTVFLASRIFVRADWNHANDSHPVGLKMYRIQSIVTTQSNYWFH